MAKSRKTNDNNYNQAIQDLEIVLEEMREEFSAAEDRIVRTCTKFRSTMINAMFEAMLETDTAKKECVETIRELRQKLYTPITEKDLPF